VTTALLSTQASAQGRRRRVVGWVLLVLVTAVHLGLGQWWFDQRMGDGAGDAAPKAIEVSFVKALTVNAPPVFAPPPPPRRRAPPVAQASASAPVAPPAPVASAPVEGPVEAVAEAASEPVNGPAVAASAAVAEAFEWPPSTQLLYNMTGSYRGPVTGTAEVNWLRSGDHYQVRLEVRVPPVFSRRMLSDGVLGPDGLSPRRYDQETEVALQATRRETVRFDGDEVQLANGSTSERLPGMQDIASQFVQMTWMFLLQPERLQVGQTVSFPLALTRRVGLWTYDVAEHMVLPLPFGDVDTFHLQPRRDVLKPNELGVETWVAPSLQYLPVRIVIRQDADNYLELQLKSAPRQTAPPPALVPAVVPAPAS